MEYPEEMMPFVEDDYGLSDAFFPEEYDYMPPAPEISLTGSRSSERGAHEKVMNCDDGLDHKNELSVVDDFCVNGHGTGQQAVDLLTMLVDLDEPYCFEFRVWRNEGEPTQ